MQLNADSIPILERWDKLPFSAQRLFNEICKRLLNLPKIPRFIETLANTNREIRYRELNRYLTTMYSALLDVIEQVLFENGHPSPPTKLHLPEGLPTVGERLESILAAMTQLEEDQDKEKTNALLRIIEGMNRGTMIGLQLNNVIPTGILRNIQLVLCDFPSIYLKEIEKLLWFNWRTACFTKDYYDSSVWGSYADGHKGACLIFESAKTDGSHQLELNEGAIKFREVVYGGKPNEVDFFRSIGRATVEQLIELWYTDAEGNFSECGDHIPRDGEIDNDGTIPWQESYWDNFYRDITSKTKDWAYEQEWRLVLEDRSGGLVEEKNHTLTYDFNALKGIIFGMKTSEKHKSEIIEIIQKKCKKYKRKDFKFYQAYYCPESGDIRKDVLPLP